MASGYLAIVLHAHLPFIRHPEHARHLEERWLFEAILECYLPLLGVLDRLAKDRVPVGLTMSLTPTLADMLQDDLLRRRFSAHLARLEALQRKEQRRVDGHGRLRKVVSFYGDWLGETRAHWERIGGDVVSALLGHVDEGRLDLLASSATHAFLPGLLHEPRAIRAQVRTGLRAFQAQTGRRPCGFWLPECAYDPKLDEILGEEGVRFSILEAHGVTLARPRPPAGVYAPIASPSGVAFFGRDLESGRQVWSRDEGYPGDPSYREFYRDIGFDLDEHDLVGEVGPYGARVNTGLKYHRVTGPALDLSQKDLYDPDVAKGRAFAHARDFVEKRRRQARHLGQQLGDVTKPIVVSPYDAELFGHWWFEGPLFLEGIFRHLHEPAAQQDVEPITLRSFLNRHPTMVRATPAASTWGAKGHSSVWVDETNAWLWRHVHHASKDVLRDVVGYQRASDDKREALRQMAVELLLLQASDWPFILKMRTAEGYAAGRARAHSARIRTLHHMLQDGGVDPRVVEDLASRDDFLSPLGEAVFDAMT